MSTQNTTLRGLGFAFAGFAVFASHDALIKVLGGTYSVMQIIFFATLFSFVPMAVTIPSARPSTARTPTARARFAPATSFFGTRMGSPKPSTPKTNPTATSVCAAC